MSLVDALTCFLYASDVRANIVERPTTCQNVNVFSAILKKLDASYKSDKVLFQRSVFRPFMKKLNLIGGVKLFQRYLRRASLKYLMVASQALPERCMSRRLTDAGRFEQYFGKPRLREIIQERYFLMPDRSRALVRNGISGTPSN